MLSMAWTIRHKNTAIIIKDVTILERITLLIKKNLAMNVLTNIVLKPGI